MCYVEIVDRDPAGYIAVDKIVFSDSDKPPEDPPAINSGAVRLEDLADSLPDNYRNLIAGYQERRETLESGIPISVWGMIAADEDPRDVRVHIRGSHTNLGAVAPRRPPGKTGFAVANPAPTRLALADWFASSGNPLPARVMVNRIWRQHFGRGIVATPDNFGRMGERPSHPELLDYLAAVFMESGWSVKAMHRLITLSSAYAMSSRGDPEAARVDPTNQLLHRMPVRRLDAESIRDAVLAVSGRLDRTLYGPGVPPHISKYQDGRGKPTSGPLDGNGRRSIYIQLRRNFLPPLFLAFDYPLPVSTAGARVSSTVPSQALMMMNNDFIAEQATYWAERITAFESRSEQRIERMFVEAFGRTPEAWERRELLDHSGDSEGGWREVAHILFNSAEFLYVR
jgi:hypothetical protein